MYTIPPSSYIQPITDKNGNSLCAILVQKSFYNYYTIGQVFLFQVYSIYDMTNDKVGFFRHVNSTATEQAGGVVRPNIFFPEPNTQTTAGTTIAGLPVWAIIIIVGVILALIIVGVVFYIRRRNKNLAKRLEDYNQLEGTNKSKEATTY